MKRSTTTFAGARKQLLARGVALTREPEGGYRVGWIDEFGGTYGERGVLYTGTYGERGVLYTDDLYEAIVYGWQLARA